jgi:hypothetical protein
MKNVHVFTSAACNYIPKVRVLVESVRKFHPEWRVHLALSDEIMEGVDLSSEPFDEIHPANSLGIPDFGGWSFCHNIVELSTAIKPFMLKTLLDRDDCDAVIYLDPDTVLFSRLDDVVEALEESNIGLTPHQTVPEQSLVAIMDNEISSLKHGIYNLGFVAVNANDVGKAFAQWWADRNYYFCRAEIPNGLFTDQRWIDLVPAFFEGVCILRSSRLNVAPWNLTNRELTGVAPDDIQVDGVDLGFYHFTGFDSGAHNTMSKKNAHGNKVVADLVDWYLKTTSGLSKDPLSKVPWKYGVYSDGSKIEPAARLVYRERTDLQQSFAMPFECSNGGFKAWWEKQGKIEYPKLFDANQREGEMAKIRQALSPGFQGSTPRTTMSFGLITQHLKDAVLDPRMGKRLVKRTWEVLRTQGVSGIKNRISR